MRSLPTAMKSRPCLPQLEKTHMQQQRPSVATNKFFFLMDLHRYFPKKDTQITNRHMKRCSTLLIISEMQIKTTMRHNLTQVRMVVIKKSIDNIGDDMEKEEPSYTVGGNVNWCHHCGELYKKPLWRFFKKLKIELPHDPAIPLLGIYVEKMKTNLKRYRYLNVHRSIIYNSPDVGATKVPVNR